LLFAAALMRFETTSIEYFAPTLSGRGIPFHPAERILASLATRPLSLPYYSIRPAELRIVVAPIDPGKEGVYR
jgi:hypothetical protein